jgi:hypothetical protein
MRVRRSQGRNVDIVFRAAAPVDGAIVFLGEFAVLGAGVIIDVVEVSAMGADVVEAISTFLSSKLAPFLSLIFFRDAVAHLK